MEEQKNTLNLHPIQLEHIRLYEVNFHSLLIPSGNQDEKNVEWNVAISNGDFQPDESVIVVGVKASVDKDSGQKLFYEANIEIHGHFAVDVSEFDVADLPKWVKGNAFYILFPYIREHVYGTVLRAGYLPPIFPLLDIPIEKAIVGKSIKRLSDKSEKSLTS